MIYCTVIKIEALRFIPKFHIKIAARVSLPVLAQNCFSTVALVGKVTAHLPPPSGGLFCHECITLLLIQKLNCNRNLNLSLPRQKSPMNLQCEIQRKPKTEDRCIYHAQMM